MRKKRVTFLLALALAVSMAAPAAAEKDEGAEVRWLDIELPEAVMENLLFYDVSYIEELDRLSLEVSDSETAELTGYQQLVYDLRRGQETGGDAVYYLSGSLLVEVGPDGSCTVLDLEGKEIPELDKGSPVQYWGDGIYTQGDKVFNAKGEVLIRGNMANSDFNHGDGYIAVWRFGGKAGVIDTQGNQVLPFEYSDVSIRPGSEGLFVVSTGSATGVVNAKGETVIPLTSPQGENDIVSMDTYRGIIAVNYVYNDRNEAKAEVYDADGSLILSLDDTLVDLSVGSYSYNSHRTDDHISGTITHPNADGYIYAYRGIFSGHSCYSIYDRNGNLVVPEDDTLYIGYGGAGFSNGVALVKTPNGNAIVDKAGNYIVSPGTYDEIVRISETLFQVRSSNMTAVIDISGETVAEMEGGFITNWEHGFYTRFGFDFCVRYFMDGDGKVFRPKESFRVQDEDNGYFVVYANPSGSLEDRLYGVVDASQGEMIIPAAYQMVCPCRIYGTNMFAEKYFLVSDGDRVGLVTNPRFMEAETEEEKETEPEAEPEKPTSVRQEKEERSGFPWLWVGLGVGGAVVLIAVVAAAVVAAKKKKKKKKAVPAPAAEGPGFCTSCGAPLVPGGQFCRNCGKKL